MRDRDKMAWILVVFLTGVAAVLSFTAMMIVGSRIAPLVVQGYDWFMDIINNFLQYITSGMGV
jgi:hypothetical protein